jgi:hypothetical protein
MPAGMHVEFLTTNQLGRREMGKPALAIFGASALAFASAANASITNLVCDPSLDDCTVDNSLSPIQSKLAWDDSSVTSPAFSAVIDFTNDVAGNYWISLNTSTPDLLFTALTITPITGSGSIIYSGPPTAAITLLPGSLGIGSYEISFSGNSPTGGAESGNLTFQLAPGVPEPATWALMLLGFGGIGFAMRRNRKPVLAHIA